MPKFNASRIRIGLMLAMLLPPSASAAISYSSPLPVSNLNGFPPASVPNRSNIAPVSNGTLAGVSYILGDDFMLSDAGAAPGSHVIDSLSIWGVSAQQAGSSTSASDVAPNWSINLYGGVDGAALALISSSFVAVQDHYVGGLNYQGATSGNYFPIFKITFSGLNWTVDANTLYDFAISASGTSLGLHATHFATSGTTGNGADDSFIIFEGSPLIATFGSDANTITDFPKGSDINVLILADAVPEPSSFALIGIGLGLLLFMRGKVSSIL